MAVLRGAEQLVVAGGSGLRYARRLAQARPSLSKQKSGFFMITKTFTRKKGGKVFVIMGVCWLAGTAALWVGVGVRKGGGSVVPGLPPGREPPGTQAKARILLAGAPRVHKILP